MSAATSVNRVLSVVGEDEFRSLGDEAALQNDTSVSVAISIDRESTEISTGRDGITVSMDSNSNMGQL